MDQETGFLITPNLEMDFPSFYDFVSDIQELLNAEEMTDIVLVAFHPEFTYDGQDPSHTTNATNRSPFPMIHIIPAKLFRDVRPEQIERIVADNQTRLDGMTWDQIHMMKR